MRDLLVRVNAWCEQYNTRWIISEDQLKSNRRGEHLHTTEGIDRNNKLASFINLLSVLLTQLVDFRCLVTRSFRSRTEK
jgi:hypothetical protein